MGMSFYFIRHGRTLFNAQHKVQGWCDSPLVEEGVAAARAIGSKLAGIEFAAAYASDKGRTCQTLAELLDARALVRGERIAPDAPAGAFASSSGAPSWRTNGSPASCAAADPIWPTASIGAPDRAQGPASDHAEPLPSASPSTAGAAIWLDALRASLSDQPSPSVAGLPLRTDWRLREWCYGDLEMQTGEMLHRRLTEGFGEELSFAEENERLPETADNLARLDRSGRAERFEDVERRVRSFLSEIGDAALAAGGGNVLAATHAFTIRTLMYLLDPARINDPLVIANGSLTRVDYDGERFILRETGALEPRL